MADEVLTPEWLEAGDDPVAAAVIAALVGMAEVMANPKPLTPVLIRGWTMTLRAQGVTAGEIEAATARVLAEENFFPTPAVFLKRLRPAEDTDAAEELAWQRVLTVLRRYGSMASLEVADLEGDACCLWTLDRIGFARLGRELTEENRAIWRAEFARLYRAACRANFRLEYLPGQFERENRASARDLTPSLAGRPDWRRFPAASGEQPALPAGENACPGERSGFGGLVQWEPGALRELAVAVLGERETDE